MPKLLDRTRELLRTRHYSLRTEEAYLHRIRDFILFHGKRHPLRWARTKCAPTCLT
ncbi:MAG TPA: phage integrase N-terminal SAM-like domain-containing protein [Pyrinomonadaceae bacterium]